MSGVFLLLDDSDPLILYDGPWNLEDSDHGDYHCLDDSDGEDGGSVFVTFDGTSIAFTGNTPDVPGGRSFKVSIDGEVPEDAQYPDGNRYEQWYQSRSLEDGPHNISLSGLVKGTTVDYVLVEAGLSTSLANSSLVVDDSSREIRYSSGWTKNNQSLPGDPDGVLSFSPLGGGTTESLVGDDDSFSFKFAGTAVYVYGVWEGAVAATFSVDDSPPSFVSTSPPSPEDEVIVNALFFQSHELEPGNHTLMCNVTDNKSFVLDYIVYTPSFDSLSDKPNLFPQPQASVSPPSPSTRSSASSSAVPSGAIAGAVAGAIVLLAVFATLGVVWFRGRKRKVALSRSSSFGDATVASGALSPPESYTEAIEVRTPLVPNRFDPNLFVSNGSARSEKYTSSSRQLSLSSRFRDFGIGWGYSKRTSRYLEKF